MGAETEEEGTVRMTPSEAHDSAWRRDAGHDEMQLAVMRLARTRFARISGFWPDHPDVVAACERVAAEALMRNGRSMFFADLMVDLRGAGMVPDLGTQDFAGYIALEVKPVIHSCGAVIRQCSVLQEKLCEWVRDGGRGAFTRATAIPVVRSSDPKAQLLADLVGQKIMVWDGAERLDWLLPNGNEVQP